MDKIASAGPRERAALFVQAAGRRPAIQAAVMEKDFWVCWTLRRLFDVLRFRPQLIFKGGTSLSKVFAAIDRFSEDVDLSLSRRDLGFADAHDPEQAGISRKEARRRLENLVGECQRVIRERLVPDLRTDFAAVLGAEGWTVELDTDDPQTILFAYLGSGTNYAALPYAPGLTRGVLQEAAARASLRIPRRTGH